MFDKWITIKNIDINLTQVVDIIYTHDPSFVEGAYRIKIYFNYGYTDKFYFVTEEEMNKVKEGIRKVTKSVELG